MRIFAFCIWNSFSSFFWSKLRDCPRNRRINCFHALRKTLLVGSLCSATKTNRERNDSSLIAILSTRLLLTSHSNNITQLFLTPARAFFCTSSPLEMIYFRLFMHVALLRVFFISRDQINVWRQLTMRPLKSMLTIQLRNYDALSVSTAIIIICFEFVSFEFLEFLKLNSHRTLICIFRHSVVDFLTVVNASFSRASNFVSLALKSNFLYFALIYQLSDLSRSP